MPGFVEHALAQNAVGAGLVSLAALLEPSHDLGVEAHGDGFLPRTAKLSSRLSCLFAHDISLSFARSAGLTQSLGGALSFAPPGLLACVRPDPRLAPLRQAQGTAFSTEEDGAEATSDEKQVPHFVRNDKN